jgi:hypothetical protein
MIIAATDWDVSMGLFSMRDIVARAPTPSQGRTVGPAYAK